MGASVSLRLSSSTQNGIEPKVVTDLHPDLQDANIVDSYDKVLWSIGPKDIARFDGKKWERIHHPDNPRIGEE